MHKHRHIFFHPFFQPICLSTRPSLWPTLCSSSHPSGPGSLCGLHPRQAAKLQAASLPAVLHVHLQHQALFDAQEHLPPAAPPLPLALAVFFLFVG